MAKPTDYQAKNALNMKNDIKLKQKEICSGIKNAVEMPQIIHYTQARKMHTACKMNMSSRNVY